MTTALVLIITLLATGGVILLWPRDKFVGEPDRSAEELDENEADIRSLHEDECPICSSRDGFESGPRGGAGQNIFCIGCGEGFNVAKPRMIVFAQRIGRRGANR